MNNILKVLALFILTILGLILNLSVLPYPEIDVLTPIYHVLIKIIGLITVIYFYNKLIKLIKSIKYNKDELPFKVRFETKYNDILFKSIPKEKNMTKEESVVHYIDCNYDKCYIINFKIL